MSIIRILTGCALLACIGACAVQDGHIYIGVSPDEIAQRSAASGQICRTERPTGSNLPQRICATEEEWAEFDEAAEQNAQQIMDSVGDPTRTFDGGNSQ